MWTIEEGGKIWEVLWAFDINSITFVTCMEIQALD